MSLCIAVIALVTVVNTQTHTHTQRDNFSPAILLAQPAAWSKQAYNKDNKFDSLLHLFNKGQSLTNINLLSQ